MCLFENQFGKVNNEDLPKKICKIDPKIIEQVFTFDWSLENKDPVFWLLVAVLLYPKVLKEIQFATEQHKQNYSNSNYTGSQKKDWKEIFESALF